MKLTDILKSFFWTRAQAAIVHAPGVTGLTGGGATKLDGLVTTGATPFVPNGAVVVLSYGDAAQLWRLKTKTAEVENGTSYVIPDDNSSLVYVRIL